MKSLDFSVLGSKIQIFISLALLNLWSTSPQCVCTVCQIGTKTVSITKNDSGISWLEIVFLARFSLHSVPKYIQMSQKEIVKLSNCQLAQISSRVAMSLSIIGNEKSRRFFSISGRSISKSRPRTHFCLRWNKNLRGFFFSFLMLDGTFFCSIPSSFNV